MSDVLRSATPSPRFRRGFAWWTARMMRRAFHRWRITEAGREVLSGLAHHDGPVLMIANHGSWWDPLVGLRVAEVFLPGRRLAAPIEMNEYERFGVLRKIGLFGIRPEHPDALPAMVEHIRRCVETSPDLLVMLTPQGRFSDPREKIRLRPGAAALAATLDRVAAVAVAVEFPFWQDQRPEITLHAVSVPPPPPPPATTSVTAWHRALTRGLQRAVDELAERVMGRDPSGFVDVPGEAGGDSASVNRLYDAWLKLRGKDTRIGGGDPTLSATGSETSK
jgi:1-acyl-sn-glycerol-3-phosphate acyltransferase